MADLSYIPNNSKQLKPYFIKQYTVVGIEYPENKFPNTDIDVIFIVKDDKFEHNFRLTGRLYKNGNLPVNVSKFLVALGFHELPSEERVRAINLLLKSEGGVDILRLVNGKTIKLLKYVYSVGENGKPKFKFWNGNTAKINDRINPFDINTKDADIEKAFLEKVNSEYGIKDYNPDLLNENVTENANTSDIPF